MGTIKRTIMDIPLNELEGVDDMFFRQIQMKQDRVMEKFADRFRTTRDEFFSGVSMTGIFESFPIDWIDGDEIRLHDRVISCRMLSELFAEADEIVLSAVTLKGYDELEAAEKDRLKILFLDGWGTAAVEKGHAWMKERIKECSAGAELNTGSSWSPGQHDVDIRLQKDLFEILRPEEIGVTLTGSFMMHPKKSISSFTGIGESTEMVNVRACDFCTRIDTCPAAYA